MEKSTKIISSSDKETKLAAFLLAKEVLKEKKESFTIFLEGDLGSGKTTFTKGFAKGLGVKSRIQSPTFVIMKKYKIKGGENFKNFFHIDFYRLHSNKKWVGFAEKGILEAISKKGSITVIEWPAHGSVSRGIKPDLIVKFDYMPDGARLLTFNFKH